MTGLDGVYALVDCDNTFFLGRKDHAVAYVDSDPTDPASAIVERDRWYKPDHIEGFFVGINITFDGWLVMTTDHGWVVLLKRDFSEYRAIQIRGGAKMLRPIARRKPRTTATPASAGCAPARVSTTTTASTCPRATTTTRWSGMANG